MNYRVVYGLKAQQSLFDIAAYLAERSPTGAANVMADIDHTVGLLAFSPLMGTPVTRSLRYQVTPKYRYRIVYRVSGTTINIRQIYHPRQLPAQDHSEPSS